MIRGCIFRKGKRIIVSIKQMQAFLYILYPDTVMFVGCTGMLAIVACKGNSLVGTGNTHFYIRAF